MSNEHVVESDPGAGALARKRRKARLQRNNNKKRALDQQPPEEVSSSAGPKTQKPHITGVKINARYDPGVKMNREELREWRKEARRIRNRESAAASRLKTRDRIDELEQQVLAIGKKYAAALERIVELESNAAAAASNDTIDPAIVPQEAGTFVVSPCQSKNCSPVAAPAATPNSPRHIIPLSNDTYVIVEKPFLHLTEMISTA